MRSWLLPLETAGKIDVEEEFQQACFHITVYKSYVPPRPAHKTAGQGRAGQRQDGQPRAGQPAKRPRPSAAPPEAAVEGQ